jgi:phosphoglycerate kinase
MRKISQLKNLKNKKILVRCDFNVPLDEKGEILDDFRIKVALPTIKYLIKNKGKVILISHLGRPKKRTIKERKKLSLKPVAEKLESLLKKSVKFLPDCLGEKVEKEIEKMKGGEILFLENLRFYKEEEEGNLEFAKALSKLGEVFIQEAFGVCHRSHASVIGVPRYLPSFAGFCLEKEIKILSQVLKNPWRPLVAIIGGIKIETKIKVIEQFLKKADFLLLGGEIANTILRVKGICVGKPWPSKEIIKEIEKFDLTDPKFRLPIDVIVSPDKNGQSYIRQSGVGKVRKEELILDIGPETIELFSKIIKNAKMIFWSGPLGYFEEKSFEEGTKKIAERIAKNHQAFKIAGGGDTLFALAKFKQRERFDHLSTGGGAMLEFLAGEKLPGIEVLR